MFPFPGKQSSSCDAGVVRYLRLLPSLTTHLDKYKRGPVVLSKLLIDSVGSISFMPGFFSSFISSFFFYVLFGFSYVPSLFLFLSIFPLFIHPYPVLFLSFLPSFLSILYFPSLFLLFFLLPILPIFPRLHPALCSFSLFLPSFSYLILYFPSLFLSFCLLPILPIFIPLHPALYFLPSFSSLILYFTSLFSLFFLIIIFPLFTLLHLLILFLLPFVLAPLLPSLCHFSLFCCFPFFTPFQNHSSFLLYFPSPCPNLLNSLISLFLLLLLLPFLSIP